MRPWRARRLRLRRAKAELYRQHLEVAEEIEAHEKLGQKDAARDKERYAFKHLTKCIVALDIELLKL